MHALLLVLLLHLAPQSYANDEVTSGSSTAFSDVERISFRREENGTISANVCQTPYNYCIQDVWQIVGADCTCYGLPGKITAE